MEEDIALKVPRNQEEHRENSARESYDEHRIVNAEPASLKFLAATFHELSTKSSCNATISATTTIVATLSAVLPSFAGNSVNPATAANSRNFSTTTRQFVKTRIKVQDLKARKPCHLSGQSCQSQEGQPWNSKLRSKETITLGM
jgi:hypothetical protein